ncbi:MAG: hemerythrin domain-containing protein [Thaumarchaeota archaeon]|nr:hemerythrin domain-containing protein [Nitrososphaerota archaeon]
MPRVDLFTPIHKGVRSMIYVLGNDLQVADFTDERATGELVAKLEYDLELATSSSCILCLLHEHAGNEDKYLFPQVHPFEPEMVEQLIQEHREVVRRLGGISKFLGELKATTASGKRIDMGIKLNQMVDDLFAFYLTHLAKEEVTILPATWRHFTDEQLTAFRTTAERNTPPERYAEWMKWVFPSLNANELTGMFAGMKQGAPPSFLESMKRIAAEVVPKDRWEIVRQRAGL